MRRLTLGKQEYERIIEHNACVVAAWKKKRKQARIQAVLKALADAREKEARAHTKVLERNEWLAVSPSLSYLTSFSDHLSCRTRFVFPSVSERWML